MALLFLSTAERAVVWSELFEAAGEQMIVGESAVTDPSSITHIACWTPPADLSLYPKLQTIISVGAGVDQMPQLLPHIQLVRTLSPGIEAMVRDWVVMATLMLHRDMPAYLDQATEGLWAPLPVRLAQNCRVGVMGLGRIGTLVADTLHALSFPVAGWSRTRQSIKGVETYDAAGFDTFIARTDILICLLPLTDETRGILNTRLFDLLPKGACLVHAGRGAQLNMDALHIALNSGQIGSAMLDVTDPEPLPSDHWMWTDPRVIVTPHIASKTDAAEGARHALAVIRAERDHTPIPGLVDQKRGY